MIVTTAERPDLVPIVARWPWEAFWRNSNKPVEQVLTAVERSVGAHPMPRTFILLENGEPVGTASLVEHDPDERRDLSPWLAGVFVVPEARGRGHAGRLIAAVEAAACEAAIPTLWLYTLAAEHLYARAGWRTVETLEHGGKSFALMRRDLG